MPPRKHVSELVVEGKNDQHVVWALCHTYNIPETFSVKTPDVSAEGIDALLESIPVRLKIPGLVALGVVLDADENVETRWRAIIHRLRTAGYDMLPKQPEPQGTIIKVLGKPTVGIWIMPDNRLPGMLEQFVAQMIPEDDELSARAESILQSIEDENLHRYALVHRPKAFIHTWLAWQKNPGLPMGQAVTAQILNYNAPLAAQFVAWLRELFVDDTE